ncbi:MAG: hypothetical protein UZ19_OD1000501 [Parcubacteria bacterium OLB19]|nr:MAG: hypothetical protein UZ19_OD1000501 [Parcubacteria bacterium OLB19]
MSSSLKNITTLLIVVTIGFVGYYIFVQNNPEDISTDNEFLQQDMYARTQSFIDYRTSLEKVAIDTSVFENPLFVSYRNFTEPVNAQAVGRSNPFAEVGASVTTE